MPSGCRLGIELRVWGLPLSLTPSPGLRFYSTELAAVLTGGLYAPENGGRREAEEPFRVSVLVSALVAPDGGATEQVCKWHVSLQMIYAEFIYLACTLEALARERV